MTISVGQSILIIAVCAVCTFLERALPFLVFGNRPVPPLMRYLGKVLPMAVMATLVIYCIKTIRFTTINGFLPEVIGIVVVVVVHLWKRNTFLSILLGTICYMLLVQNI